MEHNFKFVIFGLGSNSNYWLFITAINHRNSILSLLGPRNITYFTRVQTFTDIYNANFPLKEINVNSKSIASPWISKGLKKSSKEKQRLYIEDLKNKTIESEQKYKGYKHLFEKLRKKAKVNYYSNLIKKCGNDSKHKWRIMKEISGKMKSTTNSLPKTIKVGNQNYYEHKNIANEFNKFFTQVGPNLASKIPKVNTQIEEYIAQYENVIGFQSLTFKEFETAFKTLKRNKAAGYDDISSNIVIDAYDEIKQILFEICKKFIEKGEFPDLLKIAKVTPIFKSGDHTVVSNYRPISVLPVFSKILERIIYNKVNDFFTTNNLFYEKQFGFQKNKSTEHAILHLTNDVIKSFEKGQFTIGVFIDLSKAFDTVDHEILIKKIERYGINGNILKILKSYLKNRKQYVFYDSTTKDFLSITCGVPQGSILGPLLFLIYVNDLSRASSLLTEIMFADDTNLFMSNSNIKQLFSDMNIELAKVSTWFKANRLSLNVDKTKWTLFHSSSRKRFIPEVLPNIVIDELVIEREEITKFLGVLIDENINWKTHIEYIISKVSKSIGILYRVRDIVSKEDSIQLYYAFIQSYVNYGCIVWASTNKTKLEPLYRRQKHALRVINFVSRETHAAPLFLDIRALSIYQLNIFNILCLTYKSINKICPKAFYSLVKKKPPNKYQLRKEGLLFEPKCKTKFSQFGISYRAPHLWNALVANVKEDLSKIENFTLFQYKLKEYVLNLDLIHCLSYF